MRSITPAQFSLLLQTVRVKPRLARELKFTITTQTLTTDDWCNRELLAIPGRAPGQGVLLVQPDDDLFIAPYELSVGFTDPQTGRQQSVICDLCRTWQTGGNAATISFNLNTQATRKIAYLCCADLACSLHVRGQTQQAKLSRAQLPESLSNKERTDRLKTRLRRLVSELNLQPLAGRVVE